MIDKNNAKNYTQKQVDGSNLDNDILHSSEKGELIMDKNINLYQYISLWLELFKKNEVKDATYGRLVQSNESLHKYPLSLEKVYEVTPFDIQYYINQIKDEGYSFSTIKKQLELLRASLRKAVKLKLILENPAEDIEMPSPKVIKKPKEILSYNKKEQEKLQKYINEHFDNPAVLCVGFMIETGLRSGEVLSLQWKNVDLEKHKCHICSTIINPHLPSKSYIQDTPKTDSSIRTIPLTVCAEHILKTLKMHSSSEFIFGDKDNRHEWLEYPTLIRTIKKMCNESNVPYRGAHVFRHTFATNCYYKNINIKILSKLLGHSDVKVTYNTYINLYGDGFDDMYTALCL